MENMTNEQIAGKLTEIAARLKQAGSRQADSQVLMTVRALEEALAADSASKKKRGQTPSEDSRSSNAIGLATRVEKIKSSKASGRPLSESFRHDVETRDRTRCIGAIAFEDLWTGEGGWTSPDALWSMVTYVWRNVPDFFDSYDPDRAIEEDSSKWTQRYFDMQRNYLRHNFCLERLCHLVMVYEFLHGTEAKESGQNGCQAAERKPPTANTRKNPPKPLQIRQSHALEISLGIGLVVTCLAGYMFGNKNAEALVQRCNALEEKLAHAIEETASCAAIKQKLEVQLQLLREDLQRCEHAVLIARGVSRPQQKPEEGSGSDHQASNDGEGVKP